MKNNRRRENYRTLNELLGWRPEKNPFPSTLVLGCEAALATPLRDLTPEQVRILVGQQFGLEYVLPLAFEFLAEDPLIDVTFYPGDLLKVCLEVEPEFWAAHKDMWKILHGILEKTDSTPREIMPARDRFLGYAETARIAE